MGVYETTPDITFCTDTQARRMFLCSALRPIITDFLNTLDYTVPPKTDHTALRNAMLSYAKSSGVPYDGDKHARQCFVTGLSVAGDMYPSHPTEIQTHIGIFTWLGFLIDDTNQSIAADLALFQSRFYTGRPQPTPLLQCFADNLRATYRFWDPVAANFIVLSALAFVNANTLETRQEYRELVPLRAGANWAYHFRNIEGLPEVYTYFMFPQALYPDIGVFLQAVPDMGKFINLTNDILSFYKEEVAGETRNYISNRANYEDKTTMATMKEVTTETAQAYLRASSILSGKGRYEQVWYEYVAGYVTMHLINARYMFRDIGLDEKFNRTMTR